MPDAIAALDQATERWERAQRARRLAEVHLEALLPEAPLRLKVEATRRLRAADAEAQAAQRAYDAAQDQPCPEEW